MKLQKVQNDRQWMFFCLSCEGWTTTAYADLDGKAFTAYYCTTCAKQALEQVSTDLEEKTDTLD